ncbi:MAG: type 1 periplasmic binding fold superfamily protein [Flavobacteriales bacterium]|nr:type 1 periplasmic binding fold superfamily protein [Flavobacteriales bacterium]
MRTILGSIPQLTVLASMIALGACKKQNEDVLQPSGPAVNEEEVVTTVELTFTDQETPSQVFQMRVNFDDVGDPEAMVDTLPAQRAFDVVVRLLNESVTPAVDLTGEVRAEGTEHQLFFEVMNGNLSTSYADADSNGRPIGLVNTAITGAASSGGELRVVLRHQPDKAADGVAAGQVLNAGGETDVDLIFPLTIE